LFKYDYTKQQKTSEITELEVKSVTPLNFPIKSFYSDVFKKVLTFFRLGECVAHLPQDPS
jgi:hypothetical protein